MFNNYLNEFTNAFQEKKSIVFAYAFSKAKIFHGKEDNIALYYAKIFEKNYLIKKEKKL